MNTALILTIVAFILFAAAIVVAACAIAMSIARRREPYTVRAALRYFEQHKSESWEADT